MKYLHLFLAFLRIGLLGYGGGPSSIPLVEKEAVSKYKWLSKNEFGDMLALANTLPGPIITKMAGYIGYIVKGTIGLIIAIVASILPTILLMIVFFKFLTSFQDQPWVHGMTEAVIPVVGIMLATLTWEFFEKSKDGLGWGVSIALVIASFIVVSLLKIHPAFVIAAILIYVLVRPGKKQNEESKRSEAG
ncbi:putative transporter YwrB [Pullulanibacillus camelliae]|uniref:Putative transporter YwrB n=1 Tax=Pullulanibacillus camelliae TaxID=1707096 RepID=A0A8J2VJ80_9BACL|nr:chromate transporter [Pullulanibacillus camelliae]GGE28294.1 putative transporter YwrB [Pullulanibacillus camelliae]